MLPKSVFADTFQTVYCIIVQLMNAFSDIELLFHSRLKCCTASFCIAAYCVLHGTKQYCLCCVRQGGQVTFFHHYGGHPVRTIYIMYYWICDAYILSLA